MLEGHENLFAPIASTPQAALELIMKVLGECDHRAALYKSMTDFPENIDEYNALAIKAGKPPLQRIIVMLDESSSVLKAMGGGAGELAGKLAELTWRGRKFGVNFIFGAQEIAKELIGPLREQINLSIAFRVKPTSAQMARKIGCANAHRIPADRPGLAIVDRFGPVQCYFVPRPLLLSAGSGLLKDALTDLEKKLFSRSFETSNGRLTLANIMAWGSAPRIKRANFNPPGPYAAGSRRMEARTIRSVSPRKCGICSRTHKPNKPRKTGTNHKQTKNFKNHKEKKNEH
jgi:hypothetical protein